MSHCWFTEHKQGGPNADSQTGRCSEVNLIMKMAKAYNQAGWQVSTTTTGRKSKRCGGMLKSQQQARGQKQAG